MTSSTPTTETDYLSLGKQGRSEGWLYFLGILLGCIFYFVGGIVIYLLAICIAAGGWPEFDPKTSHVLNVDPIAEYIALNLSISPFLVSVLVWVKLVHKRSLITLVSPVGKIRWKRIGVGFVIWFLLGIVSVGIDYPFHPEAYSFTFEPMEFFSRLPLVLLMTPIQTTTEELFFRGWLLQGMALATRNIWVLSIINGLLFLVPHLLNPEMLNDPILVGAMYVGIGILLSYVTIRSNGLEYALGIHAANNLFALFVRLDEGVLPVPSILRVSEMLPGLDLVTFTVSAVIFSSIVGKLTEKESKSSHE